MKKSSGLPLIISGPSGVGKGTVIKRLSELYGSVFSNGLFISVSATTRYCRAGERDGEDYHFISEERFAELRDSDGLLEYAGYTGASYGTPAEPALRHLAAGDTVVFDIEVVGAAKIRQKLPEAVSVFIMPPSEAELERRLRTRGTDPEEKILRRLEVGRGEMSRAGEYTYVLVNDGLEDTVAGLVEIIKKHLPDSVIKGENK